MECPLVLRRHGMWYRAPYPRRPQAVQNGGIANGDASNARTVMTVAPARIVPLLALLPTSILAIGCGAEDESAPRPRPTLTAASHGPQGVGCAACYGLG
jgi:hypothetical protein